MLADREKSISSLREELNSMRMRASKQVSLGSYNGLLPTIVLYTHTRTHTHTHTHMHTYTHIYIYLYVCINVLFVTDFEA